MRGDINRRSLRWSQKRWLLDTVVETIGIEWDQARLAHYAAPAGAAAGAVFRAAGARIKKFSDAHREFAPQCIENIKRTKAAALRTVCLSSSNVCGAFQEALSSVQWVEF